VGIVNPLHEFVPFYFSWFTAMQREVEARSAKSSNELVFADVSVKALSRSARLAYFSSRNAASEFTEILSDPAELGVLDLDRAAKVKAKANRPGRIMFRASELLIPTHVPASCITRSNCSGRLT
jgi:hypothetical protein